MKMYKLSVTKGELKSLSDTEILFFVEIGRLLNEINILHKVTYFPRHDAKSTLEIKAYNLQTFVFLTISIGKLREAWDLIVNLFIKGKNSLCAQYEPLLEPEGKECFKSLKRYFGRENLIHKVRNITFHYDFKRTQQQLAKASDSHVFEMYLSENQGNCLYGMSFTLSLFSLSDLTNADDAKAALETVFNEAQEVSKWFTVFLNYCFLAIAKKHNLDVPLTEVEIRDKIKLSDFRLPFFVEPN